MTKDENLLETLRNLTSSLSASFNPGFNMIAMTLDQELDKIADEMAALNWRIKQLEAEIGELSDGGYGWK